MVLELLEFAARFAGSTLLDVVIIGLFYWPGWLLLRVLTFGHYPSKKPERHDRAFVALAGFAAILVALLSQVRGGWM